MYYYIINPTAGRGAINAVQDKLRSRLADLGIAGEFAKTTGPGDAAKMTQAATQKGYTTIVAVGGDGTVNEVINGIAKENAAIGIIPLGTSNELANRLGIKNWQQACEVLAARRLASFSLIAAGQKFFLSTLTLGFETDHSKNVDIAESGLRSRLQQFQASWNQAQHFTPLQCRVQVDDQLELEANIFTLSLANQKFNNPLADNRLVVSLSDRPSRAQLTGYLWRLLKKTGQPDESATTRFTANRVVIQTTPTTGIMIDGKLAGRTPMAIRLTDRRIRFITEKQQANIKSQL
ncbi:MAG TPA: diacylglycerol kinase family protein [Candidatus Saccharimonadales bacterium]|nr:diacylglycerol kinase family protein [Candidatus Saccharimonadales bacterium]